MTAETYFNPAADEKRILWVSHAGKQNTLLASRQTPLREFYSLVGVVFYGVCMGFLGLIFYYINVSMGWLYLVRAKEYPGLRGLVLSFSSCVATVHGHRPGIGRGPNRSSDHELQSEQMGLYHRVHLRLRFRPHRLACDGLDIEQRRPQRHYNRRELSHVSLKFSTLIQDPLLL